MKLNISCEEHKSEKKGKRDRCACQYLNRNFLKYLKIWNKTLEKKTS